jgi:thiamine biosynthesis lipoprotein ApbE
VAAAALKTVPSVPATEQSKAEKKPLNGSSEAKSGDKHSPAEQALDAAFARIRTLDKVLSDYDEASELSRRRPLRSLTASPVPVGDDLWHALERADSLSRLTDWAFDVTVGPMTRLWCRSRRQRELPPQQYVTEPSTQKASYDCLSVSLSMIGNSHFISAENGCGPQLQELQA